MIMEQLVFAMWIDLSQRFKWNEIQSFRTICIYKCKSQSSVWENLLFADNVFRKNVVHVTEEEEAEMWEEKCQTVLFCFSV